MSGTDDSPAAPTYDTICKDVAAVGKPSNLPESTTVDDNHTITITATKNSSDDTPNTLLVEEGKEDKEPAAMKASSPTFNGSSTPTTKNSKSCSATSAVTPSSSDCKQAAGHVVKSPSQPPKNPYLKKRPSAFPDLDGMNWDEPSFDISKMPSKRSINPNTKMPLTRDDRMLIEANRRAALEKKRKLTHKSSMNWCQRLRAAKLEEEHRKTAKLEEERRKINQDSTRKAAVKGGDTADSASSATGVQRHEMNVNHSPLAWSIPRTTNTANTSSTSTSTTFPTPTKINFDLEKNYGWGRNKCDKWASTEGCDCFPANDVGSECFLCEKLIVPDDCMIDLKTFVHTSCVHKQYAEFDKQESEKDSHELCNLTDIADASTAVAGGTAPTQAKH